MENLFGNYFLANCHLSYNVIGIIFAIISDWGAFRDLGSSGLSQKAENLPRCMVGEVCHETPPPDW